jgi:hypothetical protein
MRVYTTRYQGRPKQQPAGCERWRNLKTGEVGYWDEQGNPVVDYVDENEMDKEGE